MKFEILKNARLRKGLLFSAIVFFTLLFSCRKDGALVPDYTNSNQNVGDTIISITTSTIPGDTVATGDILSSNPLGMMYDDTYGLTTAELYTRIYPSTTSIEFPASVPGIDSIVFYIAYSNYYGFESQQQVMVYELDEPINSNTIYYSNHSIQPKVDPIGSGVLITSVSDSFGDSSLVLRIKMNDEFGQRIWQQHEFSDVESWINFFNGVKVTTELDNPDSKGGAIIYTKMGTGSYGKTKMVLYYHQNQGEVLTYSFYTIYGNKDVGVRFSHFNSTESTFMLEQYNNPVGKEYNYIRTMGGPKTLISVFNAAGLTTLKPATINRAELVIPFEDPEVKEFLVPERLFLIAKSDEGAFIDTREFYLYKRNLDYYGGEIDVDKKEYRFNLASTMADIINNGSLDMKLYLTTGSSSVSADRLNLNSGSHPTRPMHIEMIYTKSK